MARCTQTCPEITLIVQSLVNALQLLPSFRGKTRIIVALNRIAPDLHVRSKYGPLMKARLHDFTNWLCFTGGYKPSIPNHLKTLMKGDCFIDIGANLGIWSMMASKNVGSQGVVLAFEPQRLLNEEIRSNARLNGLGNIFVFDMAIGDRTGLFALAGSNSEHTGVGHIDTKTAGDTIVVDLAEDLKLVDKLVAERNVMVKIDVEGFELQVLKSLRALFNSRRIESLIVELDPALLGRFGTQASSIYAFMESRGFVPTVLECAPDEEEFHYDEIFVRNSN